MKKLTVAIIAVASLAHLSVAKDWAGANDTHFVEVADIGNAANSETGYGAVDYEYSIGKYEVTNAQYVKFMNSVGSNSVTVNGTEVKLYGGFEASSSYLQFALIEQNESGDSFSVATGKDNYAVNFISAYGAAMYCNWLTNGAPETSTSTDILSGAYNFMQFGASIDIFKEENININGTYRLPTADEWHKAAFYDPDSDSYFLYATASDSITEDMANYNNRNGGTANGKQYEMYPSSYGTLNQAGNVIEFISEVSESGDRIGTMGGGFYSSMYAIKSTASVVNLAPDSTTGRANGFRVAYSVSPIPEPGTYAMIFGLSALGFIIYRKRK